MRLRRECTCVQVAAQDVAGKGVAGKNWLPNVSTIGYKGKWPEICTDKVQQPKERERMRQPTGPNALQPKQPQPRVSANAN